MNKTLKTLISLFICLIMLMPAVSANAASVFVSADTSALTSEGGYSAVTITVKNSGSLPWQNITISGHDANFNTSGVIIQPGESRSFTHSVFISADLMGTTLSYTVSWEELLADGSVNTRYETVSFKAGETPKNIVTVTCKASRTNAKTGQDITLTYTIKNESGVAVKKLKLVDKKVKSAAMIENLALAPGEIYTFTYVFTMRDQTVVSYPVITYTFEGSSTESTNHGNETILGFINPQINVVVHQSENSPEGITFTLYISNNGNQKLRDITVTDDLGNKINTEPFSLGVGEQKILTYVVVPTELRNVFFSIKGESYRDQTESYPVRPYVDPALIQLTFTLDVVSPLNSQNSMELLFTLNNESNFTFNNIVITEELRGEEYVCESLKPGVVTVPITVYVESPRELKFSLYFEDYAGNPYVFTQSVTATPISSETMPEPTQNIEIDIGSFTKSITGKLTSALKILIVIAVLSIIAIVILTVLENKRRKAARSRRTAQRQQQ